MELIRREGRIDAQEMWRTFNCGIGLVIIVPASDADGVLKKLRLLKEKAYLIGEIVKRGKENQGVVIR